MTFTATVYRILIASPGDVAEERRVAFELMQDWNSVNGFDQHVLLLPVMWERDSIPQVGKRPQAILNKQFVTSCDILIAMFWTRLGTPTGKAASGTVEEINKFRKARKPILLYFSSKPVALGSVDYEQYKRLTEFRDTIKSESIFQTYDSISELREKITKHITRIIRGLEVERLKTTLFDLTLEANLDADILELFRRGASMQQIASQTGLGMTYIHSVLQAQRSAKQNDSTKTAPKRRRP
jgi:hypothetical protein